MVDFSEDMLQAITKTFVISHADDSDAQLAQALVFNAGRLAWRMRETGLDTEYKTSVSDVVTQADRAAESFISSALSQIRPQDGLLGEEGTRQISQSGRMWVIDPVDGTYNFTTGSDYWCSALALIEGEPHNPQKVHFGAVHRPMLGYTWFGGPEIPTTLDGKTLNPIDNSLTAATVCMGGYLHPTDFDKPERSEPYQRVVQKFATLRMLGSASVDMGGVATGATGLWMQRDVAPWDWLPGKALVEGVGGVCTTVTVDGTEWFLAGGATAVSEATRALEG